MERARGTAGLPFLLLLLIAVDGALATFTNVIPNDRELYGMCGQYVYHTPTFDCSSFSPDTGYSGCTGAPFQCQCLPEAPYRFQQDLNVPCKYNYGVEPCEASEVKGFCGIHGDQCTKRCDVDDNCYAADVCLCEAGYTMPSNPQYCSYAYQADQCLSAPSVTSALADDRATEACGVFATQAFFICPNGTNNFDPALCQPRCNCEIGTGRTPGSDTDCDGMDRDCNAEEIQLGCGSDLYASCKKRCQFVNSAPTIQGNCIILRDTCVLKNQTVPVSGTFACPADQVNALCGPATQSCTQYKAAGAVVNTTCVCTATGIPAFSGSVKCAEWNSYVQETPSVCDATCGVVGAFDGDHFPCQYRRFLTPSPGNISAPAGYTDKQKQVFWLTVGYPTVSLLVWSASAMSWIEQPMAAVRNVAAVWNLNTVLDMLQCTCDGAPYVNAVASTTFIETGIRTDIDVGFALTSAGPGYNNIWGITTTPFRQVQTGIPIRLSATFVGQTYTLYPADTQARIGNFYSLYTCAGPVIAATAAIALNNPEDSGPSSAISSVIRGPGTSWYVCHTSAICVQGCEALTPNAVNVVPNQFLSAYIVEALTPYPVTSVVTITMVVQPLTGASFSQAFNCPNTNFFMTNFELGRYGRYIPVVPSGYINVPYMYPPAIYGPRAYSRNVCSGMGTLNPFQPSVNGSIVDLRQLTNFGFVTSPNYGGQALLPTLLVNYTTFVVMPWSLLSTAQPGISANGYGPIAITTYDQFTCGCNPGWVGQACGVNAMCSPCATDGTCSDACAGQAQVLFDPVNLGWAQPTLVLRFDQTVNKADPLFTPDNCPFDPTGSGSTTLCDLTVYRQVGGQYCGNGMPRYTSQGIACDCFPGWTRYQHADYEYLPCTVATSSNPANCPVASCDALYAAGPRPPSCICGGHGTIDATGSCICDVNFQPDNYGCCTRPNECPATLCANVTSAGNAHILACNKTTSGAQYVCAENWSGMCCNVPEIDEPCQHGAIVSGEWIYNYSVSAGLVPLKFPSSAIPGFNPNGLRCACQGGQQWTGVSCDQSPCPSANGVICNGRGTCTNGQCMQDNTCTQGDWWGCACQFPLYPACKSAPDQQLCAGHGQCNSINAQNLTLGCECDVSYGGEYCATSACGPTDCGKNLHPGGGSCVLNSTDGTYGCQCMQTDPFFCEGTGCIWGGPTCDVDITAGCGYPKAGSGVTVCNGHGICDASQGSDDAVCTCTDGWSSVTARPCTIQPCDPNCGPNGQCIQTDNGPTCRCNPLWDGPLDEHPCLHNECIYGHPSSPNLGATCVCNDTRYTYSTQCTQLGCTAQNNVPCGQVNCAAVSQCQNQATKTCFAGCVGGAGLQNICTNGTCTCHYTAKFNPFLGYCESICAPWPLTKTIDRLPSGQPQCNCDPQLGLDPSPPSYCRQAICQNGGEWLPAAAACRCPAGWTGPRCLDQICGGRGVFNNGTSNDCTCFAPWTGSTSQCQTYSCLNGGFPVEDPQKAPDWACACPRAYRGMNCEFDQCQPHGRATPDGNACVCDPGWGGAHCDLFQCDYPNTQFYNATCDCDECVCAQNNYGPACQWLRCGPAGDWTGTDCICGGVSLPRNESGFFNCTGNSCGAFGTPQSNLAICDCIPGSTFVPHLTTTIPFNCVPTCLNGGVRNTTTNFCMCPHGLSGPFCQYGLSSSSSSSTGQHNSSSTGHASSTGTHGSTATNSAPMRRTPMNVALLLLLSLAQLLYRLW